MRFVVSALGMVLLIAGCGTGMPPGRGDIAAEAGTATLAPDRLAEWASFKPTGRPTLRDAEFAALVWVDYVLLAQAMERGLPLTDSATAARILRPDIVLQQIRGWHDSLVARRPGVAADRADSIYAGSRRLFQHILIRVGDPSDARALGQARQRAESLLAVANTGVDFAELAQRNSEDQATAQTGFLPLVGRGVLAPEFERNAWRLRPGAIGGVSSRLGFHVVRRPPLEEVRDQITAYAESLATQRADSVYTANIREQRELNVSPRTAGILRQFFSGATTDRETDTPLATWDGGALTLAEARLWIDALPPPSYLNLRGASDLTLEGFVRDVATQYLLLQEANAAGIALGAGAWAGLQDGYRRGLREALGLLGLTDSSAALSAGEAAGRANALLASLARDQTRWRPLPSALAAYLRTELGFRLHRAGLEAAVTKAVALAAGRTTTPDTSTAGAAPPQP